MLGVLSASARGRIAEFLSECAQYVLARVAHWRGGLEADLRSWLLWHLRYGLLSVGRDTATGAIQSVVVVRLLNCPSEFAINQYFHQPGGSICFAELAVADSPAALWAAIERLAQIHGRPKQLAFQRGSRDTRLRLYSWENFGNKLKGQHVSAKHS